MEDGLADLQAIGAILFVPFYLGLKAEALHLADRTPKLLKRYGRRKHSSKGLVDATCRPNCTGFAVLF